MDVSVGAVGAAFIAGLVALIGLILGKEQKTSEFRQAWIDALRVELVNYATNINLIADKISAGFSDNQAKIASLADNYSELNKSSFNIKLRVNPDEEESKNLLQSMQRFEELAQNENDFNADNIKPIEADFVESSKRLLKHEWKRVKRGEAPFIFAKWGAISAALLMAVLGIGLLLYGPRAGSQKFDKTNPPAVNVDCRMTAQSDGAFAVRGVPAPQYRSGSRDAPGSMRSAHRVKPKLCAR